MSRSSRSLWTCSLLAIRFAIITLKSNFRGSLKESQFGWGTQNSYLSWEIKTLKSIQCQDLQFLNEKIKPNLKLNENLEKHPSPRFVIFHHTWRHPQLLLVPATISKLYHLNSSIGSIQRKPSPSLSPQKQKKKQNIVLILHPSWSIPTRCATKAIRSLQFAGIYFWIWIMKKI